MKSTEPPRTRMLRAGDFAIERDQTERFEIVRTACGEVYRGRQEWRLQSADVDIVYDEQGLPLRAWRRASAPSGDRADGYAEIRSYELRTPDVTIKRRGADGKVTHERLLPGGRLPVPKGARPVAVLAPGRGAVSMWLRHAHLPVGGEARDLVLDIRPSVEMLEVGVLRRDPDQFDPESRRTFRVYTFFGQETVFADDEDMVVGDLGGLRPAECVTRPAPPPLPTFGEPDPAHTP